MNCCLQNNTTHQFTYFIYYLYQDKFKNLKINEIQQVHQKIFTKPIRILEITYCQVILHLNLKLLGFTGEPVTCRTRQSRENAKEFVVTSSTSCHIQSYQDSKHEP